MNTLDKKYQELLQDILDNGVKKSDRTGTGTISVFGRQIRHKMSDGFPLLTTKKMYWKGIVTELLWFLRGDTNIKYLVDNDCHIWDGDAYKNYLNVVMYEKPDYLHEKYGHLSLSVKREGDNYIPYTQEEFINKIKTDKKFENWADLGPVYGKQWRKWEQNSVAPWGGLAIKHIDQIENLINDLKTNPDSRRLMVTAWNPADLESSVLPPCHYGFQIYTRELSWYDDLDKIKEIYINWSISKPSGGYAGDIKVDITESANQIFVDGWQEHKDPFTGNPLIELECFSSIPKRAISLMWNQRSCDFPLGIPANIMSYAILLMMLAKQVNMVPEELIGNFGDCHIYLDQIDGVKEQLTREPYPLPSVKLSDKVVNDLSEYTYQDIILENYQSHPKIYFPLSN